jgi:hypothetical protein
MPPVLSPGITHGTLPGQHSCPRYNEVMSKSKWYRLLLLGACVLFAVGCKKHILTDYRPLDRAGMWSSNIEQLKALNASDAEVAQLVKLKQAGVTDDTCVALVSAAHEHQHPFTSAESAANLNHAGFTDLEILEIARADKLDTIGMDAVMLRLVGLSDATVQTLLHRRMQGQPTLSSDAIGRLKNVGLTEKQILERINHGMTDQQAEKEATAREHARNHSNTGFVRIHGRRSR